MKTLKNKIAYILAALVLFGSTSVFASSNKDKTDSTSVEISMDGVMTDAELNEIMISLEEEVPTWLNETVTYNIYDSEDNLIHSATVVRSESIQDPALVKLLSQSDLLMEYQNASYYRLNK